MGDGWFNFYFNSAAPPSQLDEWAKMAATASPFISIISVALTYRIARRVQATGREGSRRDITRSLGTEWNSERTNSSRKSVIEMAKKGTAWGNLSDADQKNVLTIFGFMKDALLQIEPRQLCDLATLPAFLPGMEKLIDDISIKTDWLDENPFYSDIIRINRILNNMYTRPRIRIIPSGFRRLLFMPAGELSIPFKFDADFYLRKYPDVASSAFRAFDHYRIYGDLELRRPREEVTERQAAIEHTEIMKLWDAKKKSAGRIKRVIIYLIG
mgnify:CR=1 FL=1